MGVPQAVEYVNRLAEVKPWCIEEPTAPDKYVLSLYLSAAFVLSSCGQLHHMTELSV